MKKKLPFIIAADAVLTAVSVYFIINQNLPAGIGLLIGGSMLTAFFIFSAKKREDEDKNMF